MLFSSIQNTYATFSSTLYFLKNNRSWKALKNNTLAPICTFKMPKYFFVKNWCFAYLLKTCWLQSEIYEVLLQYENFWVQIILAWNLSKPIWNSPKLFELWTATLDEFENLSKFQIDSISQKVLLCWVRIVKNCEKQFKQKDFRIYRL